MYKYLRERSKHDRARLFLVVFSDRTRGKRDLNTGNSTSKRKKNVCFGVGVAFLLILWVFFMVRVIKHQHRLLREAVQSPSLGIFKP